jgi:hypothetical protein
MTGPRPAKEFLDILLESEEVLATCREQFPGNAADVIERAGRGDATNFLDWFEEWATESPEELVCQLDGAGPCNDTFAININRSGPLYWIRAVEFYDECYFGSEEDAIAYAESTFESFITELDERSNGHAE